MKTLAELSDQQMDILVRDVEQLLRSLVREGIQLGQELQPVVQRQAGEMPLYLLNLIDQLVKGEADKMLTVVEFNLLGSVSRVSDPKGETIVD